MIPPSRRWRFGGQAVGDWIIGNSTPPSVKTTWDRLGGVPVGGKCGREMGAVIITHGHSAKFERLRLAGVDERGFETSLGLEKLPLPEPL